MTVKFRIRRFFTTQPSPTLPVPIRITTGQTVQVRGEAVGEAIRMADGSSDLVWVTLADVASNSSVSVVMRREDAAGIDTYGAYGKTGSWLRVQGVFNLACSEHEGESDIHATSVVVDERRDSNIPMSSTSMRSFRPSWP